MPDDDRLPKRVARRWREVADAIEGRHEFSTVADRIEKALSGSLRDGAAEHVRELLDGIGSTVADPLAQLQNVLGELPNDWVTGQGSCFVSEAQLIAGGVGQAIANDDLALASLLSGGLNRMAWQRCLGPVELQAVPSSFASLDEFQTYVQACLSLVRFDRFVDQIVRRVPTSAIRAPRNPQLRKSTAELLHEPI